MWAEGLDRGLILLPNVKVGAVHVHATNLRFAEALNSISYDDRYSEVNEFGLSVQSYIRL